MTSPLYPARYSDGRTAAIRQARVALEEDRLAILDESGAALDDWPLPTIRVVGLPDKDGTLRLSSIGGDARLTVNTADFTARLNAACPDLRKPISPPHVRWRKVAFWVGGAVASLLVFFFVIIPLFTREIVRLTPPRLEARMGAWMSEYVIELLVDPEAKRQGRPVCRRPQGEAALQKMIASLTAHAALPQPVVVQVVNSRHVNALALPGGRILILRGLIDAAQSSNEVAGVLAHELAHIEHRHPLRIAIEQTSGAFLVGLFFGDAVGFSLVGVTVSAMLRGYYSRGMEIEADERGIEIMRMARFDVMALSDFFTRLAQREGSASGIFSILSTHPDSGERAERVRAAPRGALALPVHEWAELRWICR